jgi:hypothetical protein
MTKRLRSLAVVSALSIAAIGLGAAQFQIASAQTAPAATADPVQIYIDGLLNGWTFSGWAAKKPETPVDNGMKPVVLSMAGWADFGFKAAAPINLKAYKTLSFAVFLTGHGKQQISVSARLKGQDVSAVKVLKGPKGDWFEVDQDIKDMHIKGDGTVDEIYFKNPDGSTMEDWYIDNVQLQP